MFTRRKLFKAEHVPFQCADGTNISHDLVNDGLTDCLHNEDEFLTESQQAHFIIDRNKGNFAIFTSDSKFPCSQVGNRHYEYKEICVYDTDRFGHMIPCRHGTHLAYCDTHPCVGYFKCPFSYCLPLHKVCDGTRDCFHGDDEADCDGSLSCPGMLKCRSGWCVHPKKICDGEINCGDESEDETICTAAKCPHRCTCHVAAIICTSVEMAIITQMHNSAYVKKLILSESRIHQSQSIFAEFTALVSLNLSYNALAVIDPKSEMFVKLKQLIVLNLSHNLIEEIQANTFSGLHFLKFFDISHNPLKVIHDNAFQTLDRLIHIQLHSLQITRLYSCSFCGLNQLVSLDLSNNRLHILPEGVFANIPTLQKLYLRDNNIKDIGVYNIRKTQSLSLVDAERQSTCCISVMAKQCLYKMQDIFSGCENLLNSRVVRYSVWIICLGAISANCCSSFMQALEQTQNHCKL